MRALNLMFRLHKPYRIEADTPEFLRGEAEFREADRLEYQVFMAWLERNTQRFPEFRVTLQVSGLWLEQAMKLDPELIRRLRKLIEKERVELVATPYYYSLANFYDFDGFETEIAKQDELVARLFGVHPKVLAMPELMYNDELAKWALAQGYAGMIAGAVEKFIGVQSSNQVFEAPEGSTLWVLAQNTKFSEAIRRKKPMLMIEERQAVEEFAAETKVAARSKAKRKKTAVTAAEFVRGMNRKGDGSEATEVSGVSGGPSGVAAGKSGALDAVKYTTRRVFSAKKLQKELELECLRGSLVSLCLDTGVFREYREAGIVRFFDELVTNWLKGAGNKLVTATEMAGMMEPAIELSVPTTVDVRGCDAEKAPEGVASAVFAVAKMEDVRYNPPRWLASEQQVAMCKKLYALEELVEKTGEEGLSENYKRLRALDYLTEGAGFEVELEIFAKRVLDAQPQPAKLEAEGTAETKKDGWAKTGEAARSSAGTAKSEAAGNGADSKEGVAESGADSKAGATTSEEKLEMTESGAEMLKPKISFTKTKKAGTGVDLGAGATGARAKVDREAADILGAAEEKIEVKFQKKARKVEPAEQQVKFETTEAEETPVTVKFRSTNPVGGEVIDDEDLNDVVWAGIDEDSDWEDEAVDLDGGVVNWNTRVEEWPEENGEEELDQAELEVQVLAQRISRKRAEVEDGVDELAEAELV